MIDSLTTGCIRGISDGHCPETIIVKVCAVKALKEPNKYRLKLNDGSDQFLTHAVFDLSPLLTRLSVPRKNSIIKISHDLTPPGVQKHTVRSISADKHALVFNHFTELSSTDDLTDSGRNVLSTPPQASASNNQLMPPPVKPSTQSGPSSVRQGVKRNLESSFNNSVVKKPATESGTASATHTIDRLNNMVSSNKYIIKVVVESKGSQREIHSRNFEGLVQDCILTDETGSIKLTAFKNDALQLDQLMVGKSYLMEGMMIKPANKNFNQTNHDFELTWSQRTRSTGPLLSNTVQLRYNFTRIKDILNMSDTGGVVDVLAWVRQTGDLHHFSSQAGRELKKRELLLVDDSDVSGASITLVLWGEEAEQFEHPDQILAWRKVSVREFKGVKQLGLSREGSYSADCEAPDNMRFWVEGMRQAIETISPTLSQPANTNQSNSVEGDITCIQEIKETMVHNNQERRFIISGYIVKINTDTMWYRAHCSTAPGKCLILIGQHVQY